MAAAAASLVGAESILALTPVAIKKTPLDPVSAIWSRVLSSAILGYAITGDRALGAGEVTGALALGNVNLLHIASSYESFRNLPAGQAMSLLYTYPLWILVFSSIFERTVIGLREYGYIALATVGAILLNQDPGSTVHAAAAGATAPNYSWGVIMGSLMAITEAGMHTILRRLGWRDPAKSVWVVNGSASLWLGLTQVMQKIFGEESRLKAGIQGGATWGDAAALTAFHSVTMFSGYWLRFFAVPRLSPVTYSILSYAGLLASYLFGMVFLGERPGWISLVGAALILVSGLLLQWPRAGGRDDKKE